MLDVPIGAPDGFSKTFRGAGSEGPYMSAGDVVVRTHVIMPKGWTRILDDLHITLSITPTEAMAGFNRTVKLPDGRTASITTSELTPPGTTITMRGYGTPNMIRADGTSP